MLAIVITESVVLVLLTVLVVGLLRSHADILRALHDLGAGVGDPGQEAGRTHQRPDRRPDRRRGTPTDRGPLPLQIGPPLPGERQATSVADVAGVTPGGDAVSVAVAPVDRLTLLAFLSSGCSSCAGIWRALADPVGAGLSAEVRVVAVTKGPELEQPTEVGRQAAGAPNLVVVMSSQAWDDYEVPGSPFFVLIEGRSGRRIGEGVANHLSQVADLVRRALAEAGQPSPGPPGDHGINLGGMARETSNDAELIAAGVAPGDPSLYPRRLEDIFAPADRPPAPPAGGAHPADR